MKKQFYKSLQICIKVHQEKNPSSSRAASRVDNLLSGEESNGWRAGPTSKPASRRPTTRIASLTPEKTSCPVPFAAQTNAHWLSIHFSIVLYSNVSTRNFKVNYKLIERTKLNDGLLHFDDSLLMFASSHEIASIKRLLQSYQLARHEVHLYTDYPIATSSEVDEESLQPTIINNTNLLIFQEFNKTVT